jgi:thiamine-monophosphate kinase
MDVSDGLLGDLEKLCRASAVSATLELDQLPVSPALAARFPPERIEQLVLHGGDDYELLFTVPADRAAAIEAGGPSELPVRRIGVIETGAGVRCERDGRVEELRGGGYDHFA